MRMLNINLSEPRSLTLARKYILLVIFLLIHDMS